ncbi:sugar phosphate isomerase/epimerase family protein [Cohnella candidum]|nr:TIM barrel protein [Cohnella candidum]
MNYSLNSWSFERYLGPLRLIEWDDKQKRQVVTTETMPEETSLLGLLVRMGSNAYHSLELAYVHLKSRNDQTLRDIRHVAEVSKVELASLLLDFGDLSSADPQRRTAELELYRKWIESAAQAGFSRVRIPAGDSSPDDRAALIRAAAGLSELAVYAADAGIRVVTENLGGLLSNSENCLRLIDLCQGKVGFTADFGNFDRNKYDQLQEVIPIAETVHAKARLDAQGRIDEVDFKKCLEICREAEFSGPFSLTYLGREDPWEKMNVMRTLSEALPTMSSPMDTIK